MKLTFLTYDKHRSIICTDSARFMHKVRGPIGAFPTQKQVLAVASDQKLSPLV